MRSSSLLVLLCSILGSGAALMLAACTTETEVIRVPAAANDATPSEEQRGKEDPPADAGKVDAAPARDAAPAVTAAYVAGESGKSCAAACKAAGKTCAAACKDHKSCGGHDGVAAPYAGYACYYRQTGSNGNSFRSNEGRSLKTCDEVVTPKWDSFGSEYTLGDYLGGNPVSCCCE